MGIVSWFRKHRYAEVRGSDEEEAAAGESLVQVQPADSGDQELDEMKRAALADIAAVEEDDKYFGRPGGDPEI